MVSHKKAEKGFIQYKGSDFFRMRLALACLSHKSVRISEINNGGSIPGISKSQNTLLKILEKITNGSHMVIAQSGTRVTFSPGVLLGGEHEINCPTDRGIGYYLEFLLYLAPFCKYPLEITFKGVTDCKMDWSVDYIRSAFLPLVKRYIIRDDFALEVKKRGLQPRGGGEVYFKFPVIKQLRPTNLVEMGKVCKFRGVAFNVKCSTDNSNKMIKAAKGLLTKFIPDVYITMDKKSAKGLCSGYGMSLVAETTEGCFLAAEAMTDPQGSGLPRSPEEIGKEAAMRLLDQIYLGGCVDQGSQALMCLMMAMNSNNVVKCMTGPLHHCTIHMLRHIREMFGVKFELRQVEMGGEDEVGGRKGMRNKVVMSCRGVARQNIARRLR